MRLIDADKLISQLEDEADRSYADFGKYAEEVGIDEDSDWNYVGLRRAAEIARAADRTESEAIGGGNSLYYDCSDEEFYLESEYQEQIDALTVAIKSSIKTEILEEMNRLREENKKLQGIKEHFEEIKRDYDRKKNECYHAVQDAKRMKLSELMKDHKVIKWRIQTDYVYGPKCRKCDSRRLIEVRLPSGSMVKDECKCKTKIKFYYYPKMYVLSEFFDEYGSEEVTARYTEKTSRNGDTYYNIYACTVLDDFEEEEKKEAIRNLNDNVKKILFDKEEECQEVCDRLNDRIGNSLYMLNGTDVRDYIKERREERC